MARKSIRIPLPSTKMTLIGTGVVGALLLAYEMGRANAPSTTVTTTSSPAPLPVK